MSGGSGFVRAVRGIRIALFGVPRRKAPECDHRWEHSRTICRADDTEIGVTLRCKVCGDLKNHWVSRI